MHLAGKGTWGNRRFCRLTDRIWPAADVQALDLMNMECPYCPHNIELDGQKHLICPECRSEIYLDKNNFIERAIREKGRAPKSMFFIFSAFVILGAAWLISGKSINHNFLAVMFFLFVGTLFACKLILSVKRPS